MIVFKFELREDSNVPSKSTFLEFLNEGPSTNPLVHSMVTSMKSSFRL